ncbi:MAG: ADOP family duplicated permease [Candidatus Acidiferrales bacterium]
MNWLKQLFSRNRLYKDLEEEVAFHLEERVDELVATGMPKKQAEVQAKREFGNVSLLKQTAREAWGWKWLDDLLVDLRFGVRMLRKNPVLTLAAVLTLALGIGANTAIFTLLYGLVLRSVPAPNATQLVRVGIASKADPTDDGGTFMTIHMLETFRAEQSAFRELSSWDDSEVLLQDAQGVMQRYEAGMVSGNAFGLLGLQPYRGRLIEPYDDVPGGPSSGWPVVLSYGFWKDYYGGAQDIVGKKITISDVPVTVVGITPPDFQGVWPGTQMKMYFPLHFEPAALKMPDLLEEKGDNVFGVAVIGRLKPGVGMTQANAEVAQLQKGLFDRFIPLRFQQDPYFKKAYLHADSARTGLPNYITSTYKKPLYLMQGLVGIVLLLCCVNIGGLMMSRIAARQQEFAVRTAMGASAKRLVLQYLTESFVIALAGSALGAAAAWYGSDLLLRFFRDPMMGEAVSVHPDKAMFWMTLLFAVATTLLCGTLPAWRASRTDPAALLKSRSTMGGRKQIAGRMFVPVQVGLSLVLVMLASLLSVSVVKLRGEQTGFDLDHVTIQTSRLHVLKLKGEAKLNLYQRMVDRLMEMPGIDSAAVTSQTPMTGIKITGDFQAVGEGANPPEDSQMAYNDVGPGYFRTMRTRILAGREFTRTDRQLNVCILNESAAEFFFPHQQALGRYVRSRVTNDFPDEVACQVIGLAEDAKFYDVRQGPPRTIYLPLSTKRIDTSLGNLVFLIHSPTKAQAVSAFRATLSEIAPTVPLVIFVTMREQMDAALGSQELITLLANFFGVVALLLSALGLYGLLSASVTQRRGEIGVRVALGATPGRVLRMILKEALGLLVWGMLLGAVGLFFAMRFVVAMLHDISAYDPMTLASVTATLVLVTILAALVPAVRAARLDPNETLRSD